MTAGNRSASVHLRKPRMKFDKVMDGDAVVGLTFNLPFTSGDGAQDWAAR
jgi:hypothetical protein